MYKTFVKFLRTYYIHNFKKFYKVFTKLTYFTVCTNPSMWTMAGVTTGLIYASSSMMTGVAVTVININFTFFTLYNGEKEKKNLYSKYIICISGMSSMSFDFSLTA